MTLLTALFGQPFNPSTFERDLDELQHKIEATEVRLVQFKKKSKTFQKHSFYWSWAIYVGYVSFLYTSGQLTTAHKHALGGALAAPVLIIGFYYLVGLYSSRISLYYLRKIRLYKKQHQSKIEELRNRANYDKTKTLLQKYSKPNLRDEVVAPTDPEQMSEDALSGDDEDAIRGIEARHEERKRIMEKRDLIRRGLYNPDSSRWSRFLETLMGKDEMGPENRYALICENCFRHNGLAPPRLKPNEVCYICPGCDFVNNPGKALKSEALPSITFSNDLDKDGKPARIGTENQPGKVAGNVAENDISL